MTEPLADAMGLWVGERFELSRWLSGLVEVGASLGPSSVRAAGADGIRKLFKRFA